MTFLETVMTEYNRMKARSFARDGYEGVKHAGIVLVACDTGLVLLTQRAMDSTDAPDVQETWEFPGGSLNPGEDAFMGASREFEEELGLPLPDGMVVNGWRSKNGVYQGFIYAVLSATPEQGWGPDNSDWVPTDEVRAIAWVSPDEAQKMDLRPEMAEFDWGLVEDIPFGVSGNKEIDMPEDEMADSTDYASVFAEPIPVHGVIAPEEVTTGDKRAFAAGSMSARAGRLPFRWAEADNGAHDGAVAVGSVDRMMRKDGLIHWQGTLMNSERADQFTGLMQFFDGRYGVSVDGDNGSLDMERSQAEGVAWFNAVRASGLTAVDIPAFSQAYVAFGPHPDMPAEDSEEFAVMVSSGDLVSFKRGPGWVTNPEDTKRIHDYWMPGHPGGDKIAWGTPGDFTRAKKLIGEKISANSPTDLRFLNQIIAQWHHDALGYWPGDLGKPGNAPDTPENRRRAATHAAIQPDKEGAGWEAVLTSSAGVRALPPFSYFERHPDTGALVIEEPDENGLRRTYGYAGEWGVCHIGKDGVCVEMPEDPYGGTFDSFHLGRTKTSDEGYITTGVITYKVDHRDADTILTESAEQQHFDNIAHAWSAVRLGQDEYGTWFSGVVLPGLPEDDITVIEATGQVSGEWKHGALRALQAVNVPGFPVMRSSAAYDDEGNVIALVASAFHSVDNGTDGSPCGEPTPGQRMQALAMVDAEVRFAALREQYLTEQAEKTA